jgi:adenosine deaminase
MLASDLHVHLDGSLRIETLVELGARAGLWSRETGPERVRRLRFRRGMSLSSCLARFETTVGLLQTAPALRRAARELVRDCYLDGVRHAEIRLCPPLHTRAGLAAEAVVEAALAGADEGVASCGLGAGDAALSARLLLSVLEGMGADEASTIVDLAVRFRDSGVAGVDLAGDESLFDPVPFASAFAAARDAGLGVTVHAGEGHPASHIATAVEALGARRVGHGVTAASDGRVLDLLRERDVTIEACLTSNTQTGAIERVEDHPLPRLLDAGVRVALATDNRFFSGTTLSREYDLAADRLSIGRAGVERMVIESATAAFLPDALRLSLARLYRTSVGGPREAREGGSGSDR